jgi:hypothetical protein
MVGDRGQGLLRAVWEVDGDSHGEERLCPLLLLPLSVDGRRSKAVHQHAGACGTDRVAGSIFLAPGEHLCRQRGRPTRAMATLFSLGEVLPMLDPATERKLIHDVV